MKMVVQALNKGRMVLLLDGLDSCLGPEGRLEGEMAGFYRDLLAGLSGGRAVITSRILPADVSILPSGARNEWVGEISPAAFRRNLLAAVAEEGQGCRQSGWQDDWQLISKIPVIFGSSPRILDQVARGLKILPRDELSRELEAVRLPANLHSLAEERERLFREIFLSRLYKGLRPAAQEGLRRAALYDLPLCAPAVQALLGQEAGEAGGAKESGEASREPEGVEAEGVEAEGMKAEGLDAEGMMEEWQAAGLCTSLDHGELFAVYRHLRPWLLERLNPVERIQAHRRAGDFLESAARSGHQALGLSRLECLLASRTQYLEARDLEKAGEVTGRICSFLDRRGLYGDLLRLNQDLLSYGEDAGALARSGLAHFYLGRLEDAREVFERALSLQQGSGDLSGQARSLYNLGLIALQQNQLDRAEEILQRSMSLQQDGADSREGAATWHSLAMISMRRKDRDQARERFMQALAMQQEAGDAAGEASSRHHLGLIALVGDSPQQAEVELEKALLLYRQVGDLAGQAAVLDGMASAASRREDYQQALERLREVQPILARLADFRAEAATWHNIGTMESQLSHRDRAQGSFRRALELQQQMGDRDGEAASLFQLGVLAVWLGRLREALILISMAGMILRSADSPDFKQIEPFVDRLSSQLSLSDQEFMDLVKEVGKEYGRDRGRGVISSVFGELE
ncbi:MAG: tetratricopeptide repeat protein [Methanosarcinales archaeon]|nr:tetratricopeptide repeat protein [Methanosarcinales archaeon]